VDPSAKAQPSHPPLGSLSELRLSLLLAALACILRPTNALIWISVAVPTLWQASQRLRYVLVRETLLCGCAVILASVVSDRLYYGVWTIPPVRFLYFNIAQSLAVFYGKNRADYYFTEGLPLLLTTALPFAIVGLWQTLQARHEHALGHRILTRLSWTSIAMTVTLSLISHKEVRFLYPILPFLHIIAARPLSQFLPAQAVAWRRATILFLLVANILLAGYASQVHQRGVIDVLAYIRHKHETRNALSTMSHSTHTTTTNTTAAFLMPCHSTPWRSHLVYPEITAWALTCGRVLHSPGPCGLAQSQHGRR
jgi:phosphatidylinositol glycan class B